MKEFKDTKCIEFYVNGMHCAACEVLIEKKLSKVAGVEKVKANLNTNKVLIEGNFEENEDELAKDLTKYIEKNGYTLSSEKQKKVANWKDFYFAIPIALIVVGFFLFLQFAGIVNILNTNGQTTYPIIFLIGIVASLSSCMAMVGGVVLSMAATYAKESKTSRNISQIVFHTSRLVSFFILGGIIGWLGGIFPQVVMTAIILGIIGFYLAYLIIESFTANFVTKLSGASIISLLIIFLISNFVDLIFSQFLLKIILAAILFILAINMFDIFPFFKKLQPKLPKQLSKKTEQISDIENKSLNIFTPILIGAITFFLPCGFTQSMQFFAIGTQSFISGALTMFVFALGTFPVLAMISFSSVSLANSQKSGIFFKTAGLIVLFFAILNVITALSFIGLLPPIINF